MEALEERLRRRGTDDSAAVARRIRTASAEIRRAPSYDYLIVNRDLERAVDEMASVLRAERCRAGRRLPELGALFDFDSARTGTAGSTPQP